MTDSDLDSTTNINRSGGADLNAQGDITIGGDVVGRDKIVSNTYNTYFTGDFVTLNDPYIRPDAVFQCVQIQDFVGREWLTAKVDALLNDEKRKSTCSYWPTRPVWARFRSWVYIKGLQPIEPGTH